MEVRNLGHQRLSISRGYGGVGAEWARFFRNAEVFRDVLQFVHDTRAGGGVIGASGRRWGGELFLP